MVSPLQRTVGWRWSMDDDTLESVISMLMKHPICSYNGAQNEQVIMCLCGFKRHGFESYENQVCFWTGCADAVLIAETFRKSASLLVSQANGRHYIGAYRSIKKDSGHACHAGPMPSLHGSLSVMPPSLALNPTQRNGWTGKSLSQRVSHQIS